MSEVIYQACVISLFDVDGLWREVSGKGMQHFYMKTMMLTEALARRETTLFRLACHL
jgi:hypothetical protein